ncbi:transporter substrate-binding domain-containing protein [Mariniluteicoccus endophyticus]
MNRIVSATVAMVVVASLGACSTIPSDPDNTLDRIRTEKVLRLGVSPNPPWTTPEGGGSEVDLVRRFAEKQGARVEVVVAGEEPLVTKLEEQQIDVMVGGITDDNPWTKSKVAKTRSYTKAKDEQGKKKKHIMAVPLGENHLLSELERHLDQEMGKTR